MIKHLTDTIVWNGKIYLGGMLHELPDDLVEAIDGTPPENIQLPTPPNQEELDALKKEADAKKAEATRKKPPAVTEL